jgi:hypothetical protein
MKYAIEIASGGMIYISSFIKIGPGIQKSGDARTQLGDLISLLLYFKNKESGLKIFWVKNTIMHCPQKTVTKMCSFLVNTILDCLNLSNSYGCRYNFLGTLHAVVVETHAY